MLLAFAPETYREACPVCMLREDAQLLGLVVYACVVGLGASIFVASLNLDRRSFWWLASPAYALMAGAGAGVIVMSLWKLVAP